MLKIINRFYAKCIKLLQSNIGRNIAHFFAHGGLHLFLLIIMGLVSIYLYKYSTYDSNPVYKPIQIKVLPPYNVPISGIQMYCSLNPETTLKFSNYREVLDFGVSYKPFTLDSLVSYQCYKDNGILFYPNYQEVVGHSKDGKCKITKITNAQSQISFRTFGGKIDDAIGNVKTDITEPRIDMLLFKTPTFSRIDSLSDGYISHIQNFDLTKTTFISEAIKGNNIFSNTENPIYYRFFIDIDVKRYLDSVGGEIIIDFAGKDSLGIYTNPKEIITIFPEPDVVRLNKICYQTPAKIKSVLDNGGLYVFMEDINKRKDIEKRTFLCTVLFGAALAFMIDIFVNLIIKWRNLVDR